jgi:hypothetical protein
MRKLVLDWPAGPDDVDAVRGCIPAGNEFC